MNARIRLTQLDGDSIPNLALMKLAHWHKAQADQVTMSRSPQPGLFEHHQYDRVYGSAIFDRSAPQVDLLVQAYPNAVIGGTGSGRPLSLTVEQVLGIQEYEHYDYSIYPEYPWSIGFTQRGCRLNCGFCVVPEKEGKPKFANTIADIWRPGTPKNVLLLDNDFFGQPQDQWEARIDELAQGRYKVCFNQGVNVRLIGDDAAKALAKVRYFDDQFTRHRLYTAWDTLGQEKIFFRGVERLEKAGIPPKHLMVYMLTGYRPGETMTQVLYRYQSLVNAGCMPYPMVYGDNPELKAFQRWVIRRYAQFVPWDKYTSNAPAPEPEGQGRMLEILAAAPSRPENDPDLDQEPEVRELAPAP